MHGSGSHKYYNQIGRVGLESLPLPQIKSPLLLFRTSQIKILASFQVATNVPNLRTVVNKFIAAIARLALFAQWLYYVILIYPFSFISLLKRATSFLHLGKP